MPRKISNTKMAMSGAAYQALKVLKRWGGVSNSHDVQASTQPASCSSLKYSLCWLPTERDLLEESRTFPNCPKIAISGLRIDRCFLFWITCSTVMGTSGVA